MTWETWKVIGSVVVQVLTFAISLGFLIAAWKGLGISRIALSTWRTELQARRQMQFCDDLNDALHDYKDKLLHIGKTYTRFHVRLSSVIKACTSNDGSINIDALHNAVTEMFNNNQIESFAHDLRLVEPSRTHLSTVIDKGEYLDIPDYDKCLSIVNMYLGLLPKATLVVLALKKAHTEWVDADMHAVLIHLQSYTSDNFYDDITRYDADLTDYVKNYYKRLLY